jgi:hypothetical protein
VSQRGVLFFRNQDLNIDEQKLLGQRLGELTGKPESSKLHRHALANSKRGIAVDENGKLDDEVSVISSEQNRKFYGDRYTHVSKRIASLGWHAEFVTASILCAKSVTLTQTDVVSRLSTSRRTMPSSRSSNRPRTSAATRCGHRATRRTTGSARPSRRWPRA